MNLVKLKIFCLLSDLFSVNLIQTEETSAAVVVRCKFWLDFSDSLLGFGTFCSEDSENIVDECEVDFNSSVESKTMHRILQKRRVIRKLVFTSHQRIIKFP